MMRCALLITAASAQSLTDCSDSSAHLKNAAITLSPDPPVLGEDVTFTVEGTLDEQITSGEVGISLMMGPINFPLTIPFAINGPAAGSAGTPMKAIIGPFKYPNIKVPLISSTKGKIEIKEQNGEQIICTNFNLPAYSEIAPAQEYNDAPFEDCSDPSAHLTNLAVDVEPPTISKGVPFTVNIKGDLDEDVTSGSLDFSVNLSLFSFSINSPFSMTPAVKATEGVDVTIGPISLPNIPLIPNAKGSIKMAEQNGEQLACFNFNMPIAGESVSV